MSTGGPKGGDGGLAAGAVPLALLAAVAIFGVFSTGGDVLCGNSGDQAPVLSRACTEQAARAGGS